VNKASRDHFIVFLIRSVAPMICIRLFMIVSIFMMGLWQKTNRGFQKKYFQGLEKIYNGTSITLSRTRRMNAEIIGDLMGYHQFIFSGTTR
jgi:hypothetical protein